MSQRNQVFRQLFDGFEVIESRIAYFRVGCDFKNHTNRCTGVEIGLKHPDRDNDRSDERLPDLQGM